VVHGIERVYFKDILNNQWLNGLVVAMFIVLIITNKSSGVIPSGSA
jgi:hypothetical protein